MKYLSNNLSGRIIFASGYSKQESNDRTLIDQLDQDLIVLLLDKNGKTLNENDILFYNSKSKMPIDSPYGYSEMVPHSNDNSVWGPSDDSYVSIAEKICESLKIRMDVYDGVCLIDLDKVNKLIYEIEFTHIHYATLCNGMFPFKTTSLKTIKNLIFKEDHMPLLLTEIDKKVDIKETPFFVSSKLKRTTSSTWEYINSFEAIDDIETFLERLLYNKDIE